MRTTATITDSAYRALIEFRVRRRKGVVKAQPLTDQAANRLYYIMVLFPGVFFLTSHFVFHMGLAAAAAIALLWFVSFLIAGLMYHRMIVSLVTKRPPDPDLAKPREYAIEGDWLVIRTADTESRISLQRAVDLVVTPTVSFLDCGELSPVLLPFGSASEQADQGAFLDALRRQIPRREDV